MINTKILDKLEKINSIQFPVFSVFLKTDRKSEPFEKVKITLKNLLKKQEKNFISHTEKEYFKKKSQKIIDYVEQNVPQARYHGLAIFAGGDQDIFEIIELSLIPKAIQDIVVLEKKPFIDIFDFYQKKFKKFAFLIANERITKIYLVQGNEILKIAETKLEIEKKTDREGVFRSKRGSGGGTAENIDEKEMDFKRHFKKLGTNLEKVCQTENVNGLLIAGTKKLLPFIEKELPKSMQKILLEKWPNDLTKLDEVTLLKKIKEFEKNFIV